MIPLGTPVRDRETGFSGVVAGWAVYAVGPDRVLVKATAPSGEREYAWFDASRVTPPDDPAAEA